MANGGEDDRNKHPRTMLGSAFDGQENYQTEPCSSVDVRQAQPAIGRSFI
jgi:hypothetical protein